jgi:paraquat-inducible protein B
MTAAQPDVTQSKKLTAIWIIPLVAVVLGIWMLVYTYMSEGPEIRISLALADGLEAGKTRVKFRNVEMGMVQRIILNDDMQGVTAIVKLEREAIPLLGEDTSFWIVTARIGGGSISGLDTLLSGAYIEISPASRPSKTRNFIALEQPPLTPVGAPGLRLILHSKQSASVKAGDPVLFNGFKVGRVESQTFDPEARQINYVIFIDAPYHSLIDSSVRFWDVSGITVDAGAEGVRLSTGSLETILLGGVAFGVTPEAEPGQPVDHNTEFQLFSSYAAILESAFEQRIYFVVEFKESLSGLFADAPVEYRGIEIGKVERILVKEMVQRTVQTGRQGKDNPIPVLIYLEPGRLGLPDTAASGDSLRDTVTQSVANGARVSLTTGNLLTGAKLISMEFYDDLGPADLGEFAGYTTLPTITTGFGRLEQKVGTLLDKFNGLPLDTTVSSINQVLKELNESLTALNVLLEGDNTQAIPGDLRNTLAALRSLLQSDSSVGLTARVDETLASLRKILEQDSTLALTGELQATLAAARLQLQGETKETYQLDLTLQEVESAARALREFLDLMEMNPEVLIRGKSNSEQ